MKCAYGMVLATLGVCVLAGCSGSGTSVTAKEEEMFRHPAKVDLSKLPPINFSHKGPMYVGAPSGATGRPNAPLPAAATAGGK